MTRAIVSFLFSVGLTTAAYGAEGVEVSWTDASNNEASFRIERKTLATGPSYIEIKSVVANVVKVVDTSPPFGVEVFYRVRACNASSRCSTYSNEIMIVPSSTPVPDPTIPLAPTNATVRQVTLP